MLYHILILIFMASTFSLSFAEVTAPVRVGYIHFPPIFYNNDKGVPEGEAIELAKTVLNESKLPFLFFERPTKRMAHEMKTGELDLWIGLPNFPEFSGTTYIGDSRLLRVSLMIYWKEGMPPIHKLEELANKSVVLINGYSYGGQAHFLQNKEREQNTDKEAKHNCYAEDHRHALKLIKMKHCDYLLDYDTPINLTLKTYPIKLGKIAVNSIEARFVVSKKNPRGKKLLNDLEESYKRLIKRGQLLPY